MSELNTVCRVVLVDDHALVREALAMALQQRGRIQIVASAADGNEGLRLIGLHKPDVAVMDIDMPGRTCFDVAGVIESVSPRTRIVVLSGHSYDTYIQMAVDAGVWGYLTKTAGPTELESTILTVASGQKCFSKIVRDRLVQVGTRSTLFGKSETPLDSLSTREREVLIQLARGLSVKEAASTLSLSRKTVDNHAQRLMSKLDIHTRADLVRFAWREKLVS